MLENIKAPIAEDMARFNLVMNEALKCDNDYIATIINHIFSHKGKQMRPLLVLLSSAANGGITEKTYIGASLVEMVHTASLVHDDVIDEAFMRRNQMSVNALWRSKIAVLAGDFLLSRSLNMASRESAEDLIAIIIGALEKLCEGELIQQEHTNKLDMTEELYYSIICKKTASLLAACGVIGAKAAGASEQAIDNMRIFGESIGMAFQIKDDMLDYQSSAKTGKPMCSDLRERKITLPLLYLINNSDQATSKKIYRILSNVMYNESDIETIYNMVNKSQAMEYAENAMKSYENTALQILNTFPDSPYKESLKLYCQYILNREG